MIERLRSATDDSNATVTMSTIFSSADDEFPFKRVLSLEGLIRFWERVRDSEQAGALALATEVLAAVESTPELRGPIEDLAVLERNRDAINRLMSAAFPWAYWDRDVAAAFPPYLMRTFYSTPRFDEHFLAEGRIIRNASGINELNLHVGRGLTAYLNIARHFYGLEIDFGYPLIFTTTDSATGLSRHFKLQLDSRFADIKVVGELPVLTDEQKRHIVANVQDLEMWRAMIPPHHFEIHGFSIATAIDVTDQEEAGALKRDLIDNDAITSGPRFARLQQRVRNLLKRPELLLGLAAFNGDRVLLVNHGGFAEHGDADCIIGSASSLEWCDFSGTYFERAVRTGTVEIIQDLEQYEGTNPIELLPLEEGYRNVMLMPLQFEDRVIGALGLWSRLPGDLTQLTAVRLNDVLPLFSIAIRRSLVDLDNRVQQIIREEYTSIHPTVEWRFREAAMRILERTERGETAEPEPIVFDGVYPLYAQSDIRGSSTQRNAAIQADLATQLQLARRIIEAAFAARPLPILENLAHRIDGYVDRLELGLGSGDEAAVLDFLKRDVESLYDHIGAFAPLVVERIDAYRSAIDAQHGIVFERRKAFEESVAAINRAIAVYVEEEEDRAQTMFPHYFEKHQTDGIDISIYVGASLVAEREYHSIYLRNLRLWQLVLMCSLARLSDALRAQLPVPLETTHLVLAQNAPLSIRFRTDEKQFDVDGAYNIRYEILKKRIDKATVRSTGERLTQPGKIAIVYSQPREAAEYREYIEFLQATGLLLPGVEQIELDELQGVQGLRALRVGVVLTPDETDRAIERIVSAAGVVASWTPAQIATTNANGALAGA
jgi:hypothetical protein